MLADLVAPYPTSVQHVVAPYATSARTITRNLSTKWRIDLHVGARGHGGIKGNDPRAQYKALGKSD